VFVSTPHYMTSKFILLQHYCDQPPYDCLVFIYPPKPTGQIMINMDHVVSIVKHSTVYNRPNTWYYCITLLNGSKVYVHEHICISSGFFSSSYVLNTDISVLYEAFPQYRM